MRRTFDASLATAEPNGFAFGLAGSPSAPPAAASLRGFSDSLGRSAGDETAASLPARAPLFVW
jgi:hypothetical protein